MTDSGGYAISRAVTELAVSVANVAQGLSLIAQAVVYHGNVTAAAQASTEWSLQNVERVKEEEG